MTPEAVLNSPTERSRNLNVITLEPKRVETVRLPMINTPIGNVRLGIHTDSMLSLLKALYSLDEKDDLLIEGRIISDQQDKVLQEHPLFLLFDTRRFGRVLMTQQLVKYLRQQGEKELSIDDVFFTARSIRDDIDHSVGWYNADEMVKEWSQTWTPNHMLPILRGVSAIHIGSNTFTQDQLEKINKKIVERILEEDRNLEEMNRKLRIHLGSSVETDKQFFEDLKAAYDHDDPTTVRQELEKLYEKYGDI